MKLYYAPGACSLSPHIVMREIGLEPQLVKVDTRTKKMDGGGDFYQVNPKGYVPALQLDDGSVLTEGPAIVQYLADRKPEAKLIPPAGAFERYKVQEWLNFVSTEIHKQFSPLFNPQVTEDARKAQVDRISMRLDWLEKELATRQFLAGAAFSVADAYLFTVLNWTRPTKIDMTRWPSLQAYHKRIAERPAVQAAMRAEGLLK